MNIPFLQQANQSIRRLPRAAGEHAFRFFVVLLVLGAIASGGIFYFSVWKLQGDGLEASAEVKFQREALEELLGVWEARQERFEQAGSITPRNIFSD